MRCYNCSDGGNDRGGIGGGGNGVGGGRLDGS